jgi:hypothetical protein
MCYGQQPRDARAGELPRRLAVVKLDVLLFAGCVDSPHGPNALSSTFEKSLREIADFKKPKSAPAPITYAPAASQSIPRGIQRFRQPINSAPS